MDLGTTTVVVALMMMISTSIASPSQARGEGEEEVQQQPYTRSGAARPWRWWWRQPSGERGGAGYGGEEAAARAPREGAARSANGWAHPSPPLLLYGVARVWPRGWPAPLPWPPSWGAPLWAPWPLVGRLGPCGPLGGAQPKWLLHPLWPMWVHTIWAPLLDSSRTFRNLPVPR